MEIGRPNQKKQPSRKGKKAWRKNIDLDEIHEGLENVREEERVYGSKTLELFEVDTSGDASLIKATEYIKPEKRLKSDEILARRSAIDPVINLRVGKKSVKKAAVGGKELDRLIRMSNKGRGKQENTKKAMMDKDGVVAATGLADLWGEEPVVKRKVVNEKTKKKDRESSSDFTDISSFKNSRAREAPKVKPATLYQAPHKIDRDEAVEIPHAGKSYNPSIDSWKELIEAAAADEELRERERLKLEDYQQRIEELMYKVDKEVDSDEEDGNNDEEEVIADFKLSVNKPVENKKKTKTQRNKEKRHKEKLEMEKKLKLIKKQLHELNELSKIKGNLADDESDDQHEQAPKERKFKKVGQHAPLEMPLELKLSDELPESLRVLRPEGNLAMDRFRSLQGRGMIEAKGKVAKKQRKLKTREVERYSFAHFK